MMTKRLSFGPWAAAGLLAVTVCASLPGGPDRVMKAETPELELRVEVLSKKQVRRTFVSGIHQDYLLARVTVVPKGGGSVEVSRQDFSLAVEGSTTRLGAEDPARVAAAIHGQQQDRHQVTVTPTGEVGYYSGPDPTRPGDPTSRKSGVYTRVGAGVGVSRGPGLTSEDRGVMELELSEKSLPEGETSAPVAGHLYFLSPSKNAKRLQLIYQPASGPELILSFQRP